MRQLTAVLLLLVVSACAPARVDPGLVGTWEVNVPNADGVARWVWAIHADGSYDFHAEGPGNVPAHSGTFEARNGKYALRSTTIAWIDSGTYRLIRHDTLSATGRLGTASWTRVQPVTVQPSGDSAASPDTATATPRGSAGVFTGAAIYDYLSRHTFDAAILEAPWKLTRTSTVDPNQQDRSDNIVGIVEGALQGATGPATISLVVYRDRAAAERAWDLDAVFDAKDFRQQPGELVSSHAYNYDDRGEARCLSRLLVHSSTTATVTCYLLVQYPTREAVIIESELHEQVASGKQEASMTAVNAGNDLLFAGLKEWELSYAAIGGRGTQ